MQHMRLFRHVLIVGLAAAVLCGCGRFRKREEAPKPASKPAAKPVAQAPEERLAPDAGREEAEASLRKAVEKHVKSVGIGEGKPGGRLTGRKPNYFKESASYPDGADGMEIVLQETESRAAPYAANVKLKKVRYATRLHKDKKVARDDDRFFRSTGEESLSYELRDGKWRQVGSLFVADRVEENINGEWVPIETAVEQTLAAEREESRGWLDRAWSIITGR